MSSPQQAVQQSLGFPTGDDEVTWPQAQPAPQETSKDEVDEAAKIAAQIDEHVLIKVRDGKEFDSELVKRVGERLKTGAQTLGMRGATLLKAWLENTRRLLDDEHDTAWVQLANDRWPIVSLNPEFIDNLDQGDDGAAFALGHEMGHLDYGHLTNREVIDARKELRKKDLDEQTREDLEKWLEAHTLAQEVIINDRLEKRLKMKTPTAFGGKMKLVEPKPTYDKWKRKAKEANLATIASYDEFVNSVRECREHLLSVPDFMPKKQHVCLRIGSGQPGDGDGESFPIDPKELDRLGERVYNDVLQRALKGDQKAIDDLLERQKMDPDNPMWGSLGVGALLGEKIQTQCPVDWWEKQLGRVVRSVVKPANRPTYNPVRGWWSHREMSEVGIDWPKGQGQPPGYRSKQRVPHLFIVQDTSGSVPDKIIEERVPKIFGQSDQWKVTLATFDTRVYHFEPGKGFRGRGGTAFDPIYQTANGKLPVIGYDDEDHHRFKSHPDAVGIITDGYAAEIPPPKYRDRYVFLIMPTGSVSNPSWNTWMLRYNCKVVRLPTTWLANG